MASVDGPRPGFEAGARYADRAALRRSRLTGWPAVIGLLAFAATAVVAGRSLAVDGLMDLYAGRFVAAHGLPHVDPFTAAGVGHRWTDQQWLAHLLLYELSRLGWWGPGLVCAAAVGIAFAWLAALALAGGCRPMPTAACLTLVYVATAQNASTRAQTLCYPLFVAVLASVLADERRGRVTRRSLPVLAVLVVWANLHGSVLVGVTVLVIASGVGVASALRRRDGRAASGFGLLAFAAAATVFATPYPPARVLAYYRSVLENPIIPRVVSEWRPPALPAAAPFAVLAVVVLVAAAVAWRRGWRPSTVLAVTAGCLLAAGLHAVRDDVWFALAGGLLLASAAGSLLGPTPPRQPSGLDRITGWAAVAAMAAAALLPLVGGAEAYLVAAAAFAAVVLGAQARSSAGLPRPGGVLASGALAVALAGAFAMVATPFAQTDAGVSQQSLDRIETYTAAHPAARVMADDATAPALLWSDPGLAGRVGYDIRYEIYPADSLRRYVRFLAGAGRPGWARTLDGYDVVAASPAYHPQLAEAIRRLPGWRLIADGPDGVVAVRAPG